jgi:hypothetical protein
MRRLVIPMLGLLACGFVAPSPSRSAAAAQSEWPALSSNNQWLMIEAEPVMDKPGGGEVVLEYCRRAKTAGYNGLVLWDSNLWDRELPASYMESARRLKAGLKDLGFTLMVQMCPYGHYNAQWSGDESMVEPRPLDPHPAERHYRYLCLAHPGIHQVWEEQIRRAEEIYHPMGWLMGYDELRVLATDARCKATRKTPGQLLREHVQKATAMIRRVTPGRTIAAWSDMFDPYFNAKPGKYYHVEGSLAASAGALDRDILVFSWNDKKQSIPYWASRGNKQLIPIYFDHDDMTPQQEVDLLRYARTQRGVVGWMYSSWTRKYDEVEVYGKRLRGMFSSSTGGTTPRSLYLQPDPGLLTKVREQYQPRLFEVGERGERFHGPF